VPESTSLQCQQLYDIQLLMAVLYLHHVLIRVLHQRIVGTVDLRLHLDWLLQHRCQRSSADLFSRILLSWRYISQCRWWQDRVSDRQQQHGRQHGNFDWIVHRVRWLL